MDRVVFGNCSLFLHAFILGFLLQCSLFQNKKIVGEDVVGQNAKPTTFKKIAPLTANALGARKTLHEEGWVVVPASKKSFQFIAENSSMTQATAKALVFSKVPGRFESYPSNIQKILQEIKTYNAKDEKELLESAKKSHRQNMQAATEMKEDGYYYLFEGKESFINGYIYFAQNRKKSFEELQNDLKGNQKFFSTKYESSLDLFLQTRKSFQETVSESWKNSYAKAKAAWIEEYEESGTRENSLVALVDVMTGYVYTTKELFAPFFVTSAKSTELLLVDGVIVPVSLVTLSSAQTIVGTGMVGIYSVKEGYSVVGPTLEASYLSALGFSNILLSAPRRGDTIYYFNQVAIPGAFQTQRGVKVVSDTTVESAKTVVGLLYDVGEATSKSVAYTVTSGVVLGYTALTALPLQMILAAPDSVFFLAWDGPRLVIASAKGNVTGFDEIPTGTIIDLEKAKKKGVKVKIESTDQKLIQKVLEKQEFDLQNEERKK